MILLSTLNVIRPLICGNNYNWLLYLNLIYEILWNGAGSGLLISMLEKFVSFDRSNSIDAIDVKINGPVLEKNSSFKMVGLTFSSKLDWCSYIISIAKTFSKKIGYLIRSMRFLFSEAALYLYKSTIRPYVNKFGKNSSVTSNSTPNGGLPFSCKETLFIIVSKNLIYFYQKA